MIYCLAKLKTVESEPRVGLYHNPVIQDAIQDFNDAGVLRTGESHAQDLPVPADTLRHGMFLRQK